MMILEAEWIDTQPADLAMLDFGMARLATWFRVRIDKGRLQLHNPRVIPPGREGMRFALRLVWMSLWKDTE